MRKALTVLSLLLILSVGPSQRIDAQVPTAPLPTQGALTGTSVACPPAVSSDPGCLAANVRGYGTVGIQITGTWQGLQSFQGNIDGITAIPLTCLPVQSGPAVNSSIFNGSWVCDVTGLGTVQVGFLTPSSYTSGTAQVSIQLAPPHAGAWPCNQLMRAAKVCP